MQSISGRYAYTTVQEKAGDVAVVYGAVVDGLGVVVGVALVCCDGDVEKVVETG